NWVDASQSTGRIVFVPNNKLFQDSLYNFTHAFPYLWDELSLTFTFESDYKLAEELIKGSISSEAGINYKRARSEIRQVGKHYAINYNHLQPRVYMKIVDNGVKLTLRYLTRARGRREIRSRICNNVMEIINKNAAVELAYPTYRIYKQGEPAPARLPTQQ
ncbi:MAG: mechanosensitive ion channel family protein, partial [bacterium]